MLQMGATGIEKEDDDEREDEEKKKASNTLPLLYLF
jgi:hypothetical protein